MSEELCDCSYCDAHGPQLTKSDCQGWKKPGKPTSIQAPSVESRVELTLGLGLIDVISAHVEGDETPCLSFCKRDEPVPVGALTLGPGLAIDNDVVRLVFLNAASVDCVMDRLRDVRANFKDA